MNKMSVIYKILANVARVMLRYPLLARKMISVLGLFSGVKTKLKEIIQAENGLKKVDMSIISKTWANKTHQSINIPFLSPSEKYIYWLLRNALDLKDEINNLQAKKSLQGSSYRLKLAFVSPLPSIRSGIANYSAELLSALTAHYDIIVIVDKLSDVSKNLKKNDYQIRTSAWLRQNFYFVDRIVYQFGNTFSHHHYMLDLLGDIPGIVVLHDFFLSGFFFLSEYSVNPWALAQELYYSHGYAVMKERYCEKDLQQLQIDYPANFRVLQKSMGVIVHSQHARQLAQYWYNKELTEHWKIIPLLKGSSNHLDRETARQALGLKNTDYLVCAFGFLSPAKLNDRLLNAWLASSLSKNEDTKLIFVGEVHGDYEKKLRGIIADYQADKQIQITGWTDKLSYQRYLSAADLAVQLRTFSKGESSLAVLDCMEYGLPVIANAHGTFAELPPDAVCLLSENFTDLELIRALEHFYMNRSEAVKLGARARAVIQTQHSPAHCAYLYEQAIEDFYGRQNYLNLAKTAIQTVLPSATKSELIHSAQTILEKLLPSKSCHQLLIDITEIESTVTQLLRELLQNTPVGYRIEPIYLSQEGGFWHYKYARQYMLKLMDCPPCLIDEVVEVHSGDMLFILNRQPDTALVAAEEIYKNWKTRGVEISVMDYHSLIDFNSFLRTSLPGECLNPG
jgi:glycosyltransferase involved in cell wall biosynthesis